MTLQTPFALATLCFLATDAMGAVRPVVFAPPTHYAIGTNVYHLCSGDFNGDQALDLAALTGDNSGGRQITLWTNDGRGKFAVRTNQPLAGVGRAMAAGDVNRDGNLDLVTVNYPLDSVSAFLGKGNGTFEGRHTELAINSGFPGVALGDFNRDGWTDVAIGTYNMRIALGDGSGFFTDFTNYPSATIYALTAIDLNKDGKLDIATADYSSSSTTVFPGHGDGFFGASTNYSGDSSEYHYSVATGDFNGDTWPDIVTANQYNGSVSVRLNNGDGTFGVESRYRVGPVIHSVVVGDFNGDGRLDIAADVARDTTSMAVWVGNGDGTFAPAQTSFTSNFYQPHPQSLVAGDFDGDGLMDLATTRGTTNSVTIRLNQSAARLHIERRGGREVLSWPNWSGYVLEFTYVSPDYPYPWFLSLDPVAVLNNRRVVTNSVANNHLFFRLRRPFP